MAPVVKRSVPRRHYSFAFADNRDTDAAWMRAAGRNGIPCTFVVDQDGKVAYVGHPMFIDAVLPKVLDRTWKGRRVGRGDRRLAGRAQRAVPGHEW